MKEPVSTPVIGICKTTGKRLRFPTIASVAAEGFLPHKVRLCVKGQAKSHGGWVWKADGPMRQNQGGARQIEAGKLYLSGMGYEEIGEVMGISHTTARFYVNIARSLGVIPKGTANSNHHVRIKATNLATGEVLTYSSIRKAVSEGGFTYSSVRNVVNGLTPSHAGFTFEAVQPKRKMGASPLVKKVANLRNNGNDNQAIAAKLGITQGTVRVYATFAKNAGLCKTWRETEENLAFKGK